MVQKLWEALATQDGAKVGKNGRVRPTPPPPPPPLPKPPFPKEQVEWLPPFGATLIGSRAHEPWSLESDTLKFDP